MLIDLSMSHIMFEKLTETDFFIGFSLHQDNGTLVIAVLGNSTKLLVVIKGDYLIQYSGGSRSRG
jgi:hypothetical protein